MFFGCYLSLSRILVPPVFTQSLSYCSRRQLMIRSVILSEQFFKILVITQYRIYWKRPFLQLLVINKVFFRVIVLTKFGRNIKKHVDNLMQDAREIWPFRPLGRNYQALENITGPSGHGETTISFSFLKSYFKVLFWPFKDFAGDALKVKFYHFFFNKLD